MAGLSFIASFAATITARAIGSLGTNLNLLTTIKVLSINSNPAVFKSVIPSAADWADFKSRKDALKTPLSDINSSSKLPSSCLLNHLATIAVAIFSCVKYFWILRGNSFESESVSIPDAAAVNAPSFDCLYIVSFSSDVKV